jgi:hypothetical protein
MGVGNCTFYVAKFHQVTSALWVKINLEQAFMHFFARFAAFMYLGPKNNK